VECNYHSEVACPNFKLGLGCSPSEWLGPSPLTWLKTSANIRVVTAVAVYGSSFRRLSMSRKCSMMRDAKIEEQIREGCTECELKIMPCKIKWSAHCQNSWENSLQYLWIYMTWAFDSLLTGRKTNIILMTMRTTQFIYLASFGMWKRILTE
jgi:hypothetical protein